jgi:hypothetical protein
MPHAHDYPFDRRCGAHACIHCDDHCGLAHHYGHETFRGDLSHSNSGQRLLGR